MFKRYYEVKDPAGRIRFASVFQDDAVWYAQELYRRDKIFCDVVEVERG